MFGVPGVKCRALGEGVVFSVRQARGVSRRRVLVVGVLRCSTGVGVACRGGCTSNRVLRCYMERSRGRAREGRRSR